MVVTLKNNTQEIERVAEALATFAGQHCLPDRFVHDVNLALEEVVVNVISYAFDDGAEHEIRLALEMDGHTLTVRVEDDGNAFDPLQAPPPDLDLPFEEREWGGLGIFLARHYMDELTYARDHGRNILTLKKRRDPELSGGPTQIPS